MAAKKGENPVLPVLNSPSYMTPSRRWRAIDPITPMVSGLVQGIRFDGPVDRFRVAPRELCRLASVLGWTAVVIGAGEIAIGAVLFSTWRREGAWWAGLLGVMLGMVATGITADAPVGTPLVAWLVGLSLVSILTGLSTLLTLDGARWLDTKDVEVCAKSFDAVCQDFDCTCSGSDGSWDMCFSPGNGDCSGVESAPPVLLASSCALLTLCVISALLLAVGTKIKCLGGGVAVREDWAHSNPAKTPNITFSPKPEEPGVTQHQHEQNEDEGGYQERGQQPLRGSREAGKIIVAEYKEEQKEDGVVMCKEILTAAEPWAVGYVNRLAGGGNKKRRDELNNAERGGRGGDGGGYGSGWAGASQ